MRKLALSLLLLLTGCTSTVEPLLSAPDAKTFDEQLKIHGPVQSSEVPTLEREAQSQDPLRARNAASLLTLSRDPKAQEKLEKLGASTADLQIWGTAAADALLAEQLGHGQVPKTLERSDMAVQGLQSSDPKLYQTAFVMAQRLKLPELQAEIPKALNSKDSEIQALAVAALTPQQARERMAELKTRLKTADYATFPKMAIALIETGDKAAWETVTQAWLDHKGDNAQLAFINDVNFHMTPNLYAFIQDRATRKDKFAREAYDILVSQVVQENHPCDQALMAQTLAALKTEVKTGQRDEDAETLVTIVSWGSNPSKNRPAWEKLMHGQPAVDFAQNWLNEHRK